MWVRFPPGTFYDSFPIAIDLGNVTRMEKMCPHPAVTRIEAADAADAIPATLDLNADCARGLLAMVTTFRAGIVIPKLALLALSA
jgi:hypothetical protein